MAAILGGVFAAGLSSAALAAQNGAPQSDPQSDLAPPSYPAFERDSPARVAAFAKIPDWHGFWQLFSIGPSGKPTPEETARETAGPSPVFTPAFLKQMASQHEHNPLLDRQCEFGFPTLLESAPLIFEFVSVPEETAIIFNAREAMHIYTDGMGHTPDDIRIDTPWGDSIGHWEGDTLVVETVGTNGLFRFTTAQGKRESTVLDDNAVYRERIRMVNADTLKDDFDITDPGVLAQPYQFTRLFHRAKGLTRVIEELDCETAGVNERNYTSSGNLTFGPPSQ